MAASQWTAGWWSPLDQAGVLSFCTMSWMTSIMWSMSRKQMDISLLNLSSLDRANVNGDRLRTLWGQEVSAVGPQKASLTRVLLRFQKGRLLLVVFLALLFMLSLFLCSGVLVHALLSYKLSPSSAFEGVVLCLVLVSVELFRVGCLTLSWAINLRTGIRLKTAVCMLVFHKMASLRTLSSVSVREMVGVLTTDSSRLLDAILLVPLVLPFPVLLMLCSAYSCYVLDYTALIGLLIFLISIVLQCVCAWLSSVSQQSATLSTVSRVQILDEVLSSIRFIKMNVLEGTVCRRLSEIRTTESKMLQQAALIQNLSATISPLVPIIAATCTFITHSWLGLPLRTTTVFPVVSIFSSMRFVLSMSPAAVRSLAEAALSVDRLQRLLLMDSPDSYVQRMDSSSSAAVVMNEATLSWNKLPHPANTQDRDDLVSNSRNTAGKSTLRSVSFTLNKGQLLGICGNAGSGKTSLICSLLDQMHLQQGSVLVDGSIAYVSQQACIFYGTVQDNILMGDPMDHSRYNRVLSSCNLEADIHVLPHGDQTMVGDQGVNLSEGQKQRIGLARAIYSDRDIYLLDDPLSTIHTHTGRHIFEECIKKDLRGKSIILVTNQLQFLEFCDVVLILKDGSVLETGSHLELMRVAGHYANLISKHLTGTASQNREKKKRVKLIGQVDRGTTAAAFDVSHLNAPLTDGEPDQLINEDAPVSRKTLQQYTQAAGGYCVSFFILFLFIMLVAAAALSYCWISLWLKQGGGTDSMVSGLRGNMSLPSDLQSFQLPSVLLIIVLLLICILKSFCFVRVTVHAATTLHNQLLREILDGPLRFFETTPTVRILDCFSGSQEDLDSGIPWHLNALLIVCLIIICVFAINSVVFPVMLLPVLVLLFLFRLLLWMFLKNVCELKRMEDTSRSSCISLCTSIAQGLSTIHAYNKASDYTQLFQSLSDVNTNHLLLLNYAIRWLCFLADCLCSTMMLPISLLVIFSPSDVYNLSMKALALCFILQLTSNCQYMIQSLMEVEVRFISVERLLSITAYESKGLGRPEVDQVSEDWPQNGAITFVDYSMRYTPNSPIVLNKLQLHIRGGEKLGIVGRTGAGKSSLGVALFRLVEPAAGSILIDGLDITSISLYDLRRKLSIIPQNPVLFTGTVRYNLDPFNRYSDEEIWAALEKTHMKDAICSLDRKLEAELRDGGGNFSVGQKQLMCLSRALLRNSKIVLLDEAMASIDVETDALIRNTIRKAFQHCTTLTVARCINTVLQDDRVLVLDRGQVIEFDRPDVLKQRPDSLFSSLLTAANSVMS